jgi:glycosyltransferase involved in cell wall biosynthesis
MRVLLIAEAANPEWVSVPLEGWAHSRAIASLVDAHIVTQVRNREAFERAGLTRREFTAINSERIARVAQRIQDVLRGAPGRGWTVGTAVDSLAYPYFERLVWRRFGPALRAGRFDIVHRLTPLSPTAPSPLARRCARIGVPFVLGPLNGGVPWPRGFGTARRRECEWLSYIRGAHKLLPGYWSTRRCAAAILVGSRDTWEQMPRRYHDKCVYIAENGVEPSRFQRKVHPQPSTPLRVIFVGRLVPYKGADMLLEAAAPLIRDGKLVVELVGDGPEMPALRVQVVRDQLTRGVVFTGWLKHEQLQDRLAASDIFAFPSIREFGGAVVLEAMAVGLTPVVVAYGGPKELVTAQTGVLIPMGSREEIVGGFRAALERFAAAPELIRPMGDRARKRVLEHFTWQTKARQVVEVYRMVLGGTHRHAGPPEDMDVALSAQADLHQPMTPPSMSMGERELQDILRALPSQPAASQRSPFVVSRRFTGQ